MVRGAWRKVIPDSSGGYYLWVFQHQLQYRYPGFDQCQYFLWSEADQSPVQNATEQPLSYHQWFR